MQDRNYGDIIFMDVNYRRIILLVNVSDNETFTFPLILIRGFINGSSEKELVVHFLKDGNSIRHNRIQVQDGKFIALLNLDFGRNELSFDAGRYSVKRTFFYAPPPEKYVVTPMYIICQDQNKSLSDELVLQETCRKISLGCRLIQTLIAETLFQCGFGKKTFLLEHHEENGNSNCLIFSSKLSSNKASRMSSEELWEYLGREIMTSKHGSGNRKFLAFLSRSKNEFSEYLAIGGGGLALCDANYLQAWPISVNEISSTILKDDFSIFESTNSLKNNFRSHFSASLGAVCHELCHTFDLGHTVGGIMGRDFNRVGLLFINIKCSTEHEETIESSNFNCIRCRGDSLMIYEGTLCRKLNINFSIKRNADSYIWKNEEIQNQKNINKIFPKLIFWFGGCATLLAYHKWIDYSRSPSEQVNSNTLQYDHIRSIVTSVNGIIIVQLRNENGYIQKYWEFCEKRKKTLFLVPICEVRRASSIVIEDLEGNLLKRDIQQSF